MPSVSERQRKFMGAELSRRRRGKETKTKLSTKELEEFASKPLAKPRAGHQGSPFEKVNPPRFIAAGKLGRLSI